MKINLMTDYAVRVICSIYKSEKGILTSNHISRVEEIPHGVLMKVLRQLRERNYKVSSRKRRTRWRLHIGSVSEKHYSFGYYRDYGGSHCFRKYQKQEKQ